MQFLLSLSFTFEDPQPLVHLPQVVPQPLHVVPVLQRVLVVRRHDLAQDILVVLLHSGRQSHHLSIHILQIFLYPLLEVVQPIFLRVALRNRISNLLVPLDVPIRQNQIQLLLILRQLLLVLCHLHHQIPQIFLFVLVVHPLTDHRLQQAQQLMSPLFLVFSRPAVTHWST